MGIELTGDALYGTISHATELVTNAGLTDSDIAARLDAVGHVFQKHRLIPEVRLSTQDIPGVFSGTTYYFKVDVSAEDAFALNIELAEREDFLGIPKNMAFDTLFVPAEK